LASGIWDWSSIVSDVTRLLGAIDQGDPKAAEELLPLVYEELRRLAAHKMANLAGDSPRSRSLAAPGGQCPGKLERSRAFLWRGGGGDEAHFGRTGAP